MTDHPEAHNPDPEESDKDAPEEHTPTEVVDGAPAPTVPEDPRNRQIEEIADAGLAMPGVPGREEFIALAMQARILSMSGAAPPLVKDNPYIAFHVAMVGRDLGISPSAALNLIDVIGEGNKVQLSLSPQLINGQIKRLGMGRIVPAVRTDERCVAVALAPHGRLDPRCTSDWPMHVDDCRCAGIEGDTEFTWQDAQEAGLAGPSCKPHDHDQVEKTGRNGSKYHDCSCRQGWKTYPKRMMWWRASGYCADDFYPEAGLGLYTAEELGAVVDEDGRPIDPASVELPEGYGPKELPPDPGDDLLSEAEEGSELASERVSLLARLEVIKAMPSASAALSEKWTELHPDNTPKTPPFPHLRRRHLPRVKALVFSIEARIKKGEWAEEVAPPPADDGLPAQPEFHDGNEGDEEARRARAEQVAKEDGLDGSAKAEWDAQRPVEDSGVQPPTAEADSAQGDDPGGNGDDLAGPEIVAALQEAIQELPPPTRGRIGLALQDLQLVLPLPLTLTMAQAEEVQGIIERLGKTRPPFPEG